MPKKKGKGKYNSYAPFHEKAAPGNKKKPIESFLSRSKMRLESTEKRTEN